MRSLFRMGFAVLLASLVVFAPSGCKDEAKPNPELKVPDVPPGGRDKGKLPGGAAKP